MVRRPATPKSQSVFCDLPPKLSGNSEKERDANQVQTTAANVPGVTSQSAAGSKASNSGFLHVLLAASIASLGGILFGYDSGIIAGAMLQIREIFDLSCNAQQLVVGSMFLSAFLSSFVGGVLVDNLGRKRALLLSSALFLSGTGLQSTSTGLAMFVTGRFVTGFAVSLSTTAQCTYIAEISPAVHRGLLMSVSEVGITVGFLLAYTVNYSFISYENGWQLMFAVAACPALLELLGTLFMPQSPHFLVLKGRHDEARKVLNVIHGENAASQELGRMQKSLLEEQGPLGPAWLRNVHIFVCRACTRYKAHVFHRRMRGGFAVTPTTPRTTGKQYKLRLKRGRNCAGVIRRRVAPLFAYVIGLLCHFLRWG